MKAALSLIKVFFETLKWLARVAFWILTSVFVLVFISLVILATHAKAAGFTQIYGSITSGGLFTYTDCTTDVHDQAPGGATTIGAAIFREVTPPGNQWSGPPTALPTPAGGYVSVAGSKATYCSSYPSYNFGALGTPAVGYYYIAFAWYSGSWAWSDPGIYVRVYYNGSTWSTDAPPVTDFTTRIIPTEPATATQVSTTTASTTVNFSADYLYASTTPQTTGFYYDQISLRLNRIDAASSSEYAFSIATDTLQTISNSVVLPANSAWTYYWGFSGLAPWGRIDGTYSSTQSLYVIANPLPLYIGTSTDNLTGLATSTCSITNVTGCVQNAVSFLFWPQQTTFDQFKTLQGNIRVHAPFGYIFYMIDSINGINETATSSFSLDIPSAIQSDYFDPLKTAIGLILFSLTGFWFYKRIRDIQL